MWVTHLCDTQSLIAHGSGYYGTSKFPYFPHRGDFEPEGLEVEGQKNEEWGFTSTEKDCRSEFPSTNLNFDQPLQNLTEIKQAKKKIDKEIKVGTMERTKWLFFGPFVVNIFLQQYIV